MREIRHTLNSKDGIEDYYPVRTQEITDQVYLLSFNDVQKVFPETENRKSKSTSYAKKVGAGDNSCWWLISPGKDNVSVAVIDENGKSGTRWATNKTGVRPVITISTTFGLE